jgi:hypothetical protein
MQCRLSGMPNRAYRGTHCPFCYKYPPKIKSSPTLQIVCLSFRLGESIRKFQWKLKQISKVRSNCKYAENSRKAELRCCTLLTSTIRAVFYDAVANEIISIKSWQIAVNLYILQLLVRVLEFSAYRWYWQTENEWEVGLHYSDSSGDKDTHELTWHSSFWVSGSHALHMSNSAEQNARGDNVTKGSFIQW